MDKAQKYYNESKAHQESKTEIHPLSLWCFILSIMPISFLFAIAIALIKTIFFYFIAIFPIISIILGILSFEKIEKNKEKYWGNGFSIAGIIISLIVLIIIFIAKFFLIEYL